MAGAGFISLFSMSCSKYMSSGISNIELSSTSLPLSRISHVLLLLLSLLQHHSTSTAYRLGCICWRHHRHLHCGLLQILNSSKDILPQGIHGFQISSNFLFIIFWGIIHKPEGIPTIFLDFPLLIFLPLQFSHGFLIHKPLHFCIVPSIAGRSLPLPALELADHRFHRRVAVTENFATGRLHENSNLGTAENGEPVGLLE